LSMQLQRWEAAKSAIVAARSVDEVKLIRDWAEAYRYAMKQAGEAPETIRIVEEIKLRSERRAGEFLKKMEKQHGARGDGRNQHKKKVELPDVIPPTLKEARV